MSDLKIVLTERTILKLQHQQQLLKEEKITKESGAIEQKSEVETTTEEEDSKINNMRESESSRHKNKIKNQALTKFENRVHELVIENYDNDYGHPGDVIDQKTNLKKTGYYDYEKFDQWTDTLTKTFKRRIMRNKEKVVDKNYFAQYKQQQRKATAPQTTKNSQSFSRESLELHRVIDKGQSLAENVELQFAKNFTDFRDMSTMVGLTAGASCNDLGITNYDCKSQLAESVQSQTRLKQPEVRQQIMTNITRGKMSR